VFHTYGGARRLVYTEHVEVLTIGYSMNAR